MKSNDRNYEREFDHIQMMINSRKKPALLEKQLRQERKVSERTFRIMNYLTLFVFLVVIWFSLKAFL